MRCTTSSRSTAPSRKRSIARRSAGGQRLDRGQLVDEQPVALVGGHPAGAGVRLARCSPPPPARPCRCGRSPGETPRWCRSTSALRADRLLGGDVVLDDRAQHVELAVVDHAAPPRCSGRRRRLSARAGTPGAECQCYGRAAGDTRPASSRGASAGAASWDRRPAGPGRSGPLRLDDVARRGTASTRRRAPRRPPEVPAEPGLVVEERDDRVLRRGGAASRSGATGTAVVLEDRRGRTPRLPAAAAGFLAGRRAR